MPRRARRTGNVFWGCAKYPKCDFTTNYEPLGGVHDADDGPLARKGEAAICLVCGSTSDTAPDDIAPGERYAGGPADPTAWHGRRGRAAVAVAVPAVGGPRSWRRPIEWSGGQRRRGPGLRGVTPVAGDPATHPALQRFLRALEARDASPTRDGPTRRPSAPTSTGWPSAASTGAGRAAADLRAYLGPSAMAPPARPSPSAWPRSARSTAGRPARTWHRATRGAPSRRRACRADCRASSRPSTSSACSTSSTPTAWRPDRRAGHGPGGRPRPARPRPSSRPPTPPGCASASWRPRTSTRSTCGAARSGSSARAARSGSGCWGGRPARPSRSTSTTAARRSLDGSPRARRRPSALPQPSRRAARASAACAIGSTACPDGRPAGRGLAAHAAPLVRDPPARRRRRPARRPGAARPREPGHDPDLHARLAGPPARGVPRCASAGTADRPVVSACVTDVTGSRAIARAGLIVSGAFLVSRVLGWVRLVVIGNAFGVTAELDAFYAAFRIPDLIYQLVAAGALSSALIPVVAGLRATDDDGPRVAGRVDRRQPHAHRAGDAGSGPVRRCGTRSSRLVTPGFDAATSARTVELTRIMVLSPIFLAVGSVATSVLNSSGRFAAAAVAPIVYNLAIIGAALILAPSMGAIGLAIGVVAGVARPPRRPAAAAPPARRAVPLPDRHGGSDGPPGAPPDGPAGDRPGCVPDHVRRRHRTGHDPGRRCGDRLHHRLHPAPDPDRDHRRAARRRPLPVAVPGCRRGRPRSPIRASSGRAMRVIVFVMIPIAVADGHPAGTSSWRCSSPEFDRSRGIGGDRGDPAGRSRRPRRPCPHRRPGPGVLRAPGHGDPGPRWRSARSSSTRPSPSRFVGPPGPARHRPGHRDRGLAGGLGSSSCSIDGSTAGTSDRSAAWPSARPLAAARGAAAGVLVRDGAGGHRAGRDRVRRHDLARRPHRRS